VSPHPIESKNIVGINLNFPQSIDFDACNPLFSFFNLLNIQHYFIKLLPNTFKSFSEFIKSNGTQAYLHYAHTPILNNIILKDLYKTQQIFQPQFFCRKNYFKQHHSWGFPIFHFADDEPEVYSFAEDNSIISQKVIHPQDIAALILFREEKGKYNAKNIIQELDKKDGQIKIKIKPGFKYHLVVIRKLFLYFNNGLRYKINIHDEFILKTQAEIIGKQIDLSVFDGAFLEGDDFFSLNGFITSGPEITRNYKRISKRQYKHDLAHFWLKFGNNHQSKNIKVSRMINTYIDGILLPKLNYIHKNTRIKASINNPYFINNLASLKTTFQINADQFIFHEDYRLQTIINLKRNLSYKNAHGEKQLSIIFGEFFNIKHNFATKKNCLTQLLSCGVNRIFFNHDTSLLDTGFVAKNILTDAQYTNVYRMWITYINRISSNLRDGKSMPKILLLYPGLDQNIRAFNNAVTELEQSAFEYDIMDFQSFINDSVCTLDEKLITFIDKSYHTIILAGISKIPLKALKKIKKFTELGGIALALDHLPCTIEEQEDQSKLDEILNKTWVSDSRLKATSCKTSPTGGKGLFQQDYTKLSQIIEEQEIDKKYPVYTSHKHIKIYVRDLGNMLTVLVSNTSDALQENVILTSNTTGSVYSISLYDGLLYTVDSVEIHEKSSCITLALEGKESYLLRINKQNLPGQENIKTINPASLNIENVPVPSDDWTIIINDQQETGPLGDKSKQRPYGWHPVFYKKNIFIEREKLQKTAVFLELTDLNDWCTVYINDKKAGSRLFPPWTFEITNLLKAGENKITIEVGHRLSNYMAGYTDITQEIAPVESYGLFGPVSLRVEN
jgi:alpha-L-rhamnosidase/Glycosyl hydrolase 2 galactose-binding domain-like